MSMKFSRQEFWSGVPFPTLEDLPNPGIKPASLAFPALAGGFFTTAPPGNLHFVESGPTSTGSEQGHGNCASLAQQRRAGDSLEDVRIPRNASAVSITRQANHFSIHYNILE